jgi:hypothetical protein
VFSSKVEVKGSLYIPVRERDINRWLEGKGLEFNKVRFAGDV